MMQAVLNHLHNFSTLPIPSIPATRPTGIPTRLSAIRTAHSGMTLSQSRITETMRRYANGAIWTILVNLRSMRTSLPAAS